MSNNPSTLILSDPRYFLSSMTDPKPGDVSLRLLWRHIHQGRQAVDRKNWDTRGLWEEPVGNKCQS